MLIYTPFALCFVTLCGIFMHFPELTYSRDAIVPVPCFCCFCVSEKLHRKYSQNWTKQKPNLIFLPKLHEEWRWDRGGPGAGHTLGWRGPGLRHQGVSHLGPPFDAALSPISSPRREKPKGWISFPRNILQATAIIVARSGGSRALPGTLPERGIPVGGLLHHHGRLRSDVWIVYLGLWVHSSS
jgi:hypothetical protein